MIRLLITTLLALAAITARAADWYVDGAVTGSSGNSGASWANAWTNFASVNFSSLSAGDTLWVAKGTYNEAMTISKGGSAGNPINVRAAQDASHAGLIYSGTVAINANNVTVSGARWDGATNLFTYTDCVTNLNTNIWWQSTGVWPGSGYGTGHTIEWMLLTNQNALNFHAIRINADPNPVTNETVRYVEINRCGEDGIAMLSNPTPYWDNLVVAWCWIKGAGDDGIECGPGTTVHHCRIESGQFLRGHPDGIQASGNYHRVYNNKFFDWGSSILLMQGQAPEGGTYGHIHVYGNYIYYKDYPYPGFNVQTTEFEFKWYPSDASFNRTNVTYADWVFANNTVAYLQAGGIAWEARTGFPGCTNHGWISNITANTIIAVNNLFYQCTNSWLGIPWGWNVKETCGTNASNFWNWGPTDVQINYSVFATNGLNNGVSWMGTNFTTGEALAAHYWKSNSSSIPSLTDPANYDFRPTAGDTVLYRRGTNLASLSLPGWATDLNGNARASNPTIGASEPYDSGLLVWITFDDDFSDSRLDDSSGTGHHAYRFGRQPSTYPTNFPTRVAVTNTPGRTNVSASDYAGEFHWYPDGWGLYGRSGQYAGITNVAGLTNMPTATIACWARYHHYSTNGGSDYTADSNAELISAGDSQGVTGGWQLGRFNSAIFLNNTRFSLLTNGPAFSRLYVEFPEGNIISSGGETTNWHHYAVTFNSGTLIGYYDGLPFVTNDVSGTVTALKIDSYAYATPGWISIGCQTHSGNPWLDDEPPPGDSNTGNDYPNHGWMAGVIDDVRIYNRALAANEIAAIAGGSGSSGGGSGGGESGGGSTATGTKHRSQGKLLFNGKILL